MSLGDKVTTANVTFPWDTTGGSPTYVPPQPEQPTWKQPWEVTQPQIWPPEPHPAELEKFEEFVIWACGFTDPENPPSQKKWEEFQKKVQELAADFVEYKRQRREAERVGQPYVTYSTNL